MDRAADLLQLVLSTPTVDAYLEELVVLAGGVNRVIAGCGITVRRGTDVLSIAASNALAREVGELQHSLGQGPGTGVMETGRAISVEDIGTEQRFGAYPARALASGVHSSFSVPLTVAGTTVGALDFYSRSAHSFTRVVRDQSLCFAAQAEVALGLALRAAAQTDIAHQLQVALTTRSTIDRALGVVMVDKDCDAGAAFAVLPSASRSCDGSLYDAAVELMATARAKVR